MRFLSFRTADGSSRTGWYDLADPDTIHDVTDALPAGDGGPARRLIAAAPDGDPGALADATRKVSRSEVELLAPVPDPGKIVAAPVNYRNHQAEMSQDSHIDALGVFLKAPSSVTAHGGAVDLPYSDRRFDQEGELAAVIGRTARHVSEADALDHVFGLTALLDMTMRGGEDRSVRKSFDTFTPFGPTLVPLADLPPLDELELHLWVNGTLRQRADVADLIWSLPRLIAYVSSVMTLQPGDVISTGTPEGVGNVDPDDRIDLDITGLDRLSVTVTSARPVPSPTRGANRGPVPPARLTPVAERAYDATAN